MSKSRAGKYQTGERRVVQTPAIFSMIGPLHALNGCHSRSSATKKDYQNGTLVANAPAGKKQTAAQPLETSLPGIFAAGDVRSVRSNVAPLRGEGGMASPACKLRSPRRLSAVRKHRALARVRNQCPLPHIEAITSVKQPEIRECAECVKIGDSWFISAPASNAA